MPRLDRADRAHAETCSHSLIAEMRFGQACAAVAAALFLAPATEASEPPEIVRGPRGKAQIALTFDAGANAECFYDLIDALAKAHVKSTFFITGKWARENPDCAREITRQGHEIGNHTWNHFDLTQQSDAIIREELARTEAVLTNLCGRNPRPLWRAPNGARDQRVLRIASMLGYRSVYWTIDSLDSVGTPKSVAFLCDRIANRKDDQLDGAIILMHVGYRSTADVIPLLTRTLEQRGFHFVTLSKLLSESDDARD